MKTQRRYLAEWIAEQRLDESGEWNPSQDEYRSTTHKTFKEAKEKGIAASRAAGCCPWVRIQEQERRQYRDEHGTFTRWETVAAWAGDWEDVEPTYES